jgi:hypothetical protein
MLPLKQIGETIEIAMGSTVAPSVNGATLILVSNQAATWGYFQQFTDIGMSGDAQGFPVPPGGQVLVVGGNNINGWCAEGAALYATAVEIMKFN